MPTNDQGLAERVSRDQANAAAAVAGARRGIAEYRRPDVSAGLHGSTKHDRRLVDLSESSLASHEAISEDPFQVMVEVHVETEGRDGEVKERDDLWYANVDSPSNEVFGEGDSRIPVLSWTHPGIQLALAADIGDCQDVTSNGLMLRSVEPIAKARFDAVIPEISGVYSPGGPVRPGAPKQGKTGLKAVKLHMTKDQVDAFVSRMAGMMVVTGAPGSGKTTVAFQRIRFLLDQQNERVSSETLVRYTPELTRIFLANENLAEQTKELLKGQLSIPTSVVEGVERFIGTYLDRVWSYKHNARPRRRNLSKLELAARSAISGLSETEDLVLLWERYERQIAERLGRASEADWTRMGGTHVRNDLDSLARAFRHSAENFPANRDPSASGISMEAVYGKVSRQYEAARRLLNTTTDRSFDEAVQKWLYWVYDPLSAVGGHFGSRESQSAYRIRRGTAGRVDEAEVIAQARRDWDERVYGPEDVPWLAWLLRFALPSTTDRGEGFREITSALAPAMTGDGRWTHIVIDEAQDLSVADASLLGSLVDPDGALTVSADFKQIVNPVRALQNPKAFNVGRSLRGTKVEQTYPFARNMRQSKQIGLFLRGFHESAFGERANFDVNDELEDIKPQLVVVPHGDFARRIKQIAAILNRSEVVSSVALLQINEDAQFLESLRDRLTQIDVSLAPIWSAAGDGLLTTSVERIKGLEFDACIVLGLEDVEKAALNFTLNRTYVALSRPARRLFLICSEFPPLLRKMDKSLFDVTQS